MDELILELPEMRHEESANAFKKEFFDHGETVINGSAMLDQMAFSEWLDHTTRNRHAETVDEGWTQATTFFVMRKSDGKLIGMIDIRHNLHNAFLAEYGGHIGYAVRPDERRKGYASQMLQMALAFAGTLGIEKVMLGSYSDNKASIKTILKCGGVFVGTKPYVNGKSMDVFWIDLSR